jgi:hypothetical protein
MQIVGKLVVLGLATMETMNLVGGQWPGYSLIAGGVCLVVGGLAVFGGK